MEAFFRQFGGGGAIVACDARRRRARAGVSSPRRRPWPGDRVVFPGRIHQPAVSALVRGRGYFSVALTRRRACYVGSGGLAHGLAVVATPVGAHGEVIEPDQSGLLVRPGDATALAVALIRVIHDPVLRERLRAGARKRFLDRYTSGLMRALGPATCRIVRRSRLPGQD